MTRRFLLAALLGVVPALAADLPTVDQIIDHYVEATGGKAAYEKIHSEHVTGTLDFAAMGIKGKIERWAAEPSQYYATLDIAGIGKTEMGYTDGVAWEKSAVLGVRGGMDSRGGETRGHGQECAPLHRKPHPS